MRYIVHDIVGNILRIGHCPEDLVHLQAKEGEIVIEDVFGDTDDSKHLIIDGKRVDYIPTPRVLTYAQQRQMNYPLVEDQLDAMWKGGQDATDMRARVLAVKAKFPKPVKEQ